MAMHQKNKVEAVCGVPASNFTHCCYRDLNSTAAASAALVIVVIIVDCLLFLMETSNICSSSLLRSDNNPHSDK